MRVPIHSSDQERREIYRILDIREKLLSDQAYLKVRRQGNNQPAGDFPRETRSQLIEIRLSLNDHLLCVAHRYVLPSGSEWTQPDPKSIQIDELALIEEPIRT